MQSEKMLALSRSYGTPVFNGWAWNEKPAKDAERKGPECESSKAKRKKESFKTRGMLNNVNTARQWTKLRTESFHRI